MKVTPEAIRDALDSLNSQAKDSTLDEWRDQHTLSAIAACLEDPHHPLTGAVNLSILAAPISGRAAILSALQIGMMIGLSVGEAAELDSATTRAPQ